MEKELNAYIADEQFDIKNAPTLNTKGQPENKELREQWINEHSKELYHLQNLLYADGSKGILVILQGMDTSGKDGVIRYVFHNVNPQGVRFYSFKSPTEEELAHDYLWRIHKQVPKKGEIVVFNRSHYEDVLISRVRNWIDDTEVAKRIKQINDFERMLIENNILVVKIFLHISKDEQKKRLQKRIENKQKWWKFNPADLEDRKLWDNFQAQYQHVIRQTSTSHAPWFIVPSDSKSSRNIIIMQIMTTLLKSLDLHYPVVDNSNWPKLVE